MKAKWFSLGCLTSMLLVVLVFVLSIFGLFKLGSSIKDIDMAKKAVPGSYLRVNLSGSISDYNEFKNESFMNTFGETTDSAYDIIEKIQFAKDDPNISGILLEAFNATIGFATSNEIMLAIEEFKTSGKPVLAYIEMAGNKDYFLSTVADQIYLNPSASAGIMLTGIGSNMLFYKDLFDNIGIEMTVVHAGKYKGAGENYSRTNLSDPVRENISLLFDDIYEKIISVLAANRGLQIDDVRYIFEARSDLFINQNNALDYGLVDQLADKQEIYAIHDIDPDKIVNLSKYSFAKTIKLSNQVAIIFAEGGITPVKGSFQSKVISASKMYRTLEKIESDSSIKACVIRVSSPGGSALESEKILTKIKVLREKIPVVVSMGNVAASGGYYIAMASDYIVADPFVITGSIGVVSMFPNLSKLSEKVGITTDSVQRGKFVNSFDLFSTPNKGTIAAIKEGIEGTYLEFKSRVAEGRGLSLSEVEKYAQGQVWSSDNALQYNLIDEVGTLQTAISKAAELANLNGYSESVFPKKKSMFEEILREKFDIDLPETLFKSKYLRDSNVEETFDFWLQIKSDPIQTVLPYKIEL